MNGREVFKFAVRQMGESAVNALKGWLDEGRLRLFSTASRIFALWKRRESVLSTRKNVKTIQNTVIHLLPNRNFHCR